MAFSRDSYATLSEVHWQCTHTHTHWNTLTDRAVLVNHTERHVQMLLLWFRAFRLLNGTDVFTILPRSVDEKGIWELGNGVRDRCNTGPGFCMLRKILAKLESGITIHEAMTDFMMNILNLIESITTILHYMSGMSRAVYRRDIDWCSRQSIN